MPDAGRLIRRLRRPRRALLLYTDVDRDGTPGGDPTSRTVTRGRRGASAARFLYSGGIGSADHLRALAELRQVNLGGVIVGKALYERRFTVAEGQRH